MFAKLVLMTTKFGKYLVQHGKQHSNHVHVCKISLITLYISLQAKRTASPESKSCLIRYQPGVLFLKGSMRECLIQRMLQEKESEFCEKKTIKSVIVTDKI